MTCPLLEVSSRLSRRQQLLLARRSVAEKLLYIIQLLFSMRILWASVFFPGWSRKSSNEITMVVVVVCVCVCVCEVGGGVGVWYPLKRE